MIPPNTTLDQFETALGPGILADLLALDGARGALDDCPAGSADRPSLAAARVRAESVAASALHARWTLLWNEVVRPPPDDRDPPR